jgi:hypothetical protein
MALMNKITLSNGEILTGKLWRKQHSFFKDLPFYSNVPRVDDMALVLEKDIGEGSFQMLLMVSLSSASFTYLFYNFMILC